MNELHTMCIVGVDVLGNYGLSSPEDASSSEMTLLPFPRDATSLGKSEHAYVNISKNIRDRRQTKSSSICR